MAADDVKFYRPVMTMQDLQPDNIGVSGTWPSTQTGGGAISASSSFFDQISHQEKNEISVGIFGPTRR
jgi:hypothetical protein